jgi:prophage regulatory protein
MDTQSSRRILRLPSVKARTGLSRSTIYLRMSEGSFPTPVSLGARAVGWIESDVDFWLSALSAKVATQPEHRSSQPQQHIVQRERAPQRQLRAFQDRRKAWR